MQLSCGAPPDDARNIGTAISALQTAHLTGAIFTTVVDGMRVNANLYEAKEDVYLDGGPGPNAPSTAAGLPEGNYFFQVTDPSGKDLLSSDHISCREFHVNEHGVIDAIYAGTNYVKVKGEWTAVPCQHAQGVDADHGELGAITVQLFPYDDTPNPGGVYKVWVTRVQDYTGNASYVPDPKDPKAKINGEEWSGGNAHGFVPAFSKTDNYKVEKKGKPCDAPLLTLEKFHDANANGAQDEAEPKVEGWKMGVIDPLTLTSNNYYTTATVIASKGSWTVIEDEPFGSMQTSSYLDGQQLSVMPPGADPTVVVEFANECDEQHTVLYGNVGVGRVAACKVLDRDGDGTADEGEPPVAGWKMILTGTNVLGSAVGPITGITGESGCAHFADLLPGSYEIEEQMPLGEAWVATGDVKRSFEITSTVDGGTIIGSTVQETFTNLCTAVADFNTKGFWHNKNGLALITNEDIAHVNGLAPYSSPSSYFDAGDEPFDGKTSGGDPVSASLGTSGEQIAPAGSPQAEISLFLVDANAGGDPREQLAQQLLAFIFNTRHALDDAAAAVKLPTGTYQSAAELIAQAIAAWSGDDAAAQGTIASLLVALNNTYDLRYIPKEPCEVQYE